MKTQQVVRLVGYYEYMRALSIFDALAKRLSPAELKVLDEILQDRDEFSIFTNISRRVETAPGPLTEPPLAAGDQFQRRGLAWMMALSRVELGAMVAGFTDHPNPFTVLPPTAYEMPQFKEMMLDGLRTHYLALQNDPVTGYYWTMRAGRPGTLEINEMQAIAYSRRVLLAIEFAEAVQQLGQHELTPPQQAQVALWRKDLEQLLDVILRRALLLGVFDSEGVVQNTRTQAVDQNNYCLCPRARNLLPGFAPSRGPARPDNRTTTQQISIK